MVTQGALWRISEVSGSLSLASQEKTMGAVRVLLEGKAVTRLEAHADDGERLSADRDWTFLLTLIATTLVVAVIAYVLSVVFLSPSAKTPRTQRAATIAHAHS